MSSGAGAAADQIVNHGLKATEEATKLMAWGLKNLGILLAALYKENKDIFKKEGIAEVFEDDTPPEFVRIRRDEVARFKQEAKPFKFKPIPFDDGQGEHVEMLVRAKYAPCVNLILERLGYAEQYNSARFHEEKDPKNSESLVPQEKRLSEQGNISSPNNTKMTTSKPSVTEKVEGIKLTIHEGSFPTPPFERG